MANKTRCPNCQTVFLITPEQFKQSLGKVRCGNCDELFMAEFLDDQEKQNVQFDAGSSLATDNEQGTPKPESNPERGSQVDPKGSIDASKSEQNVNAELDSVNKKPTIKILESESKTSLEEIAQPIDEAQIDEAQSPENSVENESQIQEEVEAFSLDTGDSNNRLTRKLGVLILIFIALLLGVVLVFQLWLRQSLPVLENEQFVRAVSPLATSADEALEQVFSIEVPERRDLANLRLISTQIEPHPQRASTTLLKITLANNASISQPYPWLELVLTDRAGRVVARRTLLPEDYLHNNRLKSTIRPRELRKVTIELLAFPRQAHGYELKIVR